MVRFILLLLLVILVARAVWQLFDGLIEGATGGRIRRGSTPATPRRGVQMVRDPVCGTFVLPDHAVAITDGSAPVYFCSTRCRDAYRARTA